MIIDYNNLALQSLVPKCVFTWYGSEWEGLVWQDERPCPTKEQWESEKQRLIDLQPYNECKQLVQSLLQESDFADLYSNRGKIENIDEWDAYRLELQKLRINPVIEPVIPNKPKVIWKHL